jgi:aminoglycoside/choline kinase family phosphotransferase
MISDALIQHTISRFPRLSKDAIRVEPLEKGGSDRKYYRIRVPDGTPLILVKYGDQRDENRHYVAIAQFLDAEEIRVPRIYFHDEAEGLIWMEDLGEVDLWAHRGEPWSQRRELYRSALEQAARLHSRAHCAEGVEVLHLQIEFNAELYRWEQDYFFDNCLGLYFKIAPETLAGHRCDPALEQIAAELAALPRVLVHRDFQSQNIMIKEGDAYFIDFQGLRPGLAQYDLASLLYDPYVSMEPSQREELLEDYMKMTGVADAAPFRRVFDLCAMQRLMQALGAYGFLGLVKGRPQFLEHIPAAMASLDEVLERIPGLEALGGIIAGLH